MNNVKLFIIQVLYKKEIEKLLDHHLDIIMEVAGFDSGVLIQGFRNQHVIPRVTALLHFTEHRIFTTENLQYFGQHHIKFTI